MEESVLSKEEVFKVFQDFLIFHLPNKFFDFLWDLQAKLVYPESIEQRLTDHLILLGQVTNAQSTVDSRLSTFKREVDKKKCEYELWARNFLGGKPTIDQIKATIFKEKEDYVNLVEKLDAFEVLSKYLEGLKNLCLARQITTIELSERERFGR